MIDVAIVGAGLSGLALARTLLAEGLSVTVLDARHRAGGRILTDDSLPGGAAVDLGASWFWPDTEPRITALLRQLALDSLAQPDAGQVLNLADASQAPAPLDVAGIHGGARRLHGGMGTLIGRLLADMPSGTVQLGHRLVSVLDKGEHVELHLAWQPGSDTGHTERPVRLSARRVVLTMPPRLMAQHVRFDPALPERTQAAMQATCTWMAREAKSFARYARPFWLEQGFSGNAFVSHVQAVLREVWDASDTHGAALAGFHAIPPDARPHFERSMPLLVASQLAQLFGPHAHADAITTQDWAREPWTCSALDLAEPASLHPQADPILRRPHWSGRLYFGGTETARQAAGHMEGALESADRLADYLRPARQTLNQPARHVDEALAQFNEWVRSHRQDALPIYRAHLTQMLSRQDRDRLTQRAMLAAAEQTYTRALAQLASLDLQAADLGPSGQHALTPQVLAPFAGFSKTLVDEALAFNAGSCALSNFQHEHRPDADYLRAITADLAAAWREFAWNANDLLGARQALHRLAG